MLTRTSRAAACALLATTALTLPAAAYAETPAPRFIDTIDDHGVDLVTGLPYLTIEEGGIGSGPGRVAMQRIYAEGAGFLDNWTGGLYDVTSGGVTKKYLQFGGISETFSGSGTTWTSDKADGGTLDVSTGTYTARDGTKIVFQTIGEDKIGCPGVTTLGACQNPVSITRPDGLKLTLGWDLKVVCIDQPGEPCAIEHDHARLASVSSSAGYKMTIAYASNVGPYTATDPWYQRTSVTFGNTASPPSPAPTITYTRPSSTVTNVTDPAGRMWVFTSDSSGRLVGVRRPGSSSDNISYAYGTGGTVSSSTKDGVTNSYSYSGATATLTNPLGQQTVVSSASGRPTSYKDGLNRTISFAYDGNSRLTQITAQEGNSVVYTYDLRGNVTATVLHDKSNTNSITTRASFDTTCTNIVKCNKPNSTTDAKGNITTYLYDPTHGGITSVTRPLANATATVQPQTRFSYTRQPSASGDLVYVLTGTSACQVGASCTGTADETKTSIAYNSNLLPSSVSRGDGTGALTATTAMTYDSHGNLTTVNGPLADTTNAPTLTLTDTTSYVYDSADQRVGMISPDPDGYGSSGGPLLSRGLRTTYRPDGQVSKQELGTVSDPANWSTFAPLQTVDISFDANARAVQQQLSAGGSAWLVSQQSYDALGRLECAATRMNPNTWGSLPGACTPAAQGSDGPDRISKLIYDPAGQVTQLKIGVGTAAEQSDRRLTYTGNGQVETLTDAENNKTTYTYDGFDRLSQTQYPSSTKGANASNAADYEQLSYDLNGNVVSRRLRDGQSIAYTRDNLNRVTFKDLPGTEPDVTYAYDNLGRMTSAAQTGIALAFTWDALGRKLSEAGPLGTTNYAYEPDNEVKSLSSNDYAISVQHLVTGETSAVLNSAGGAFATYAYDNLGNRSKVTFGNGVVQSYAYDGVSRLQTLGTDLPGTPNYVTIGGATTPITYNHASQITSTPRSNDAFAFNGLVNVNRNYVSNGLNQYSAVATNPYSYDQRGNLTSDGTTTYGYSSENLLTSTLAGVTLTYDPLGRLYQVTTPSATRRFRYDGVRLIAEYDGSGARVSWYVHGPAIDEAIVWGDASGQQRYLQSDERGSIIAVTDGNGALVSANKYDEFGIPGSGNSQERLQYTGQMWLPELGMYYYKARIYSATLGRFMQPDPIGYKDSLNLYAYVVNDPVNLVDSSGLEWVGACVAVVPAPGVAGSTTFDCGWHWRPEPGEGTDIMVTRAPSGGSGSQQPHQCPLTSGTKYLTPEDALLAGAQAQRAQQSAASDNSERSFGAVPLPAGGYTFYNGLVGDQSQVGIIISGNAVGAGHTHTLGGGDTLSERQGFEDIPRDLENIGAALAGMTAGRADSFLTALAGESGRVLLWTGKNLRRKPKDIGPDTCK